MNQIKSGETEDDPVLFLEIETSIQQKTANDAAMEPNDVGPHVRYQLVKQCKNHKLHSRTDDTDDGVKKKVSVTSIYLA